MLYFYFLVDSKGNRGYLQSTKVTYYVGDGVEEEGMIEVKEEGWESSRIEGMSQIDFFFRNIVGKVVVVVLELS